MGPSMRARYTLEFKLEAVRLAKRGNSIAATAKILGLPEQTLHNWIKAEQQERLGGPGTKAVSREQKGAARSRRPEDKEKITKPPANDVLPARLAALRGAVVFSSWPDTALTLLAEKSRMESVGPNVTVHPVGNLVNSIHILVSGVTQTGATDKHGRRVSLKLHTRGEVHGLFLWATQDRKLRHDMVTLVPSTFLVIPIKALNVVLAKEPHLWHSIAIEASRRLLAALEIAMGFGLEAPRVRFARQIVQHLEDFETGPDRLTPQLLMSQQTMAELLGVSRQTVTSLVREFASQGLIQWRYGRIAVLDRNGLRRAAKFVWQRDGIDPSA